ncbi:asparagine--tRNA ligase [bacterium]|nr:asparagine--tRNA ligase [bacterium]
MSVVYIENIADYEEKEVTLKGWLYNKRSSKKLHFLQFRDGTGIIQVIVSRDDTGEEMFAIAESLTQESSFIVTGIVKKDSRSKIGFEIHASSIESVQMIEYDADDPQKQGYPITPKEHGTAFLMENRHLWLRSRQQWAILRIRHSVIRAIRDFFDNRGFILFDTPILTPAACEGTSTLFEVDYYDKKAYLTQSGQLYAEAGAIAFGKVYCFGPTFRAEKSKTRRHLTEFWMVEPEVAYITLKEDMELAEQFVAYIVKYILETRTPELEILERDISKLQSATELPYPRVHYNDALKMIEEAGDKIEWDKLNWGDDFGSPHETYIAGQFDKPVFIHRFPVITKSFYMQPDPEDDKYSMSMDLLAPEGYGEIIGGSQRVHDHDLLMKRIKDHNLPLDSFQWYLDLRKYGSVPHAGFGLGVERFVTWICGIPHIRQTIPFPRMLDRIYP